MFRRLAAAAHCYNYDGELDVLDIISIVEIILNGSDSNYDIWASDINQDINIDIFDIIILINTILD